MPPEPIPVRIHDEEFASRSYPGLMREWRWTNADAGEWEGCVATAGTRFQWIEGSRIRRADPANSPMPPSPVPHLRLVRRTHEPSEHHSSRKSGNPPADR